MKKQIYKTQISFLTNAELLNEYEQVIELCDYVSYDNFEYTKLKIIKDEFYNRGLGALIG